MNKKKTTFPFVPFVFQLTAFPLNFPVSSSCCSCAVFVFVHNAVHSVLLWTMCGEITETNGLLNLATFCALLLNEYRVLRTPPTVQIPVAILNVLIERRAKRPVPVCGIEKVQNVSIFDIP